MDYNGTDSPESVLASSFLSAIFCSFHKTLLIVIIIQAIAVAVLASLAIHLIKESPILLTLLSWRGILYRMPSSSLWLQDLSRSTS
jgi:hypothetical protein